MTTATNIVAKNRWTAALGWQKTPYIVTLVVIIVLVAVRVWDPVPLQVLRLKSFDLYQQIHPRKPTSVPVVIVDFDEESLAAYGQWPWPRSLLAELVNKLMALEAGVIGFDIVFAEPDRLSPDKIATALYGVDADIQKILMRLPGNDAIFASTLERSRVVLGQSMTHRPVPSSAANEPRKHQFAEYGGDPRPYLINFPGIVRNVPELEAAAAGLGMFTHKPEIDGVVRRVPMVMRHGDDIYPSLTLEMLHIATGQYGLGIKSNQAGISSIIVPTRGGKGFTIPTDAAGRIWINYTPHDRGRYVSAKDVLDGTVPRQRIKGHFVLVGTSAVGLLDLKSTPVDNAMPGVEIQAQLLETILADKILIRPNYATTIELIVLIGLCLLMAVVVQWERAVWTFFSFGALIAMLVGLSWYLYVEKGMLLGVAYIALCGLVLYSIIIYLDYVREESARRQIRTAFSQYLSPALVERLAANPEQLKLGGEIKSMSILFSDIRGFTSISESFMDDPDGLTHIVNRYFTAMTDRILESNGTIDKYMGDAVMAFWNAPIDDEDHARHMCEAALNMLDGLKKVNLKLQKDVEIQGKQFSGIDIGIGLNTGMCVVGNMGSEQRFTYSVLGDAVNLASRLESQCRTYGVTIIVSENTYVLADDLAVLELDLVKVKGKDQATRIYALMGLPRVCKDETFKALSGQHHAMLAAYRRQDWTGARDHLASCHVLGKSYGLDDLYSLYERRIVDFENSPPGPQWDGVAVAATK